MSPEYAAEWVRKAEADKTTAEVCRKLSKRRIGQAEIACFHAQQCAEKYLKAMLAQAGRAVPRIHDLLKLAAMAGVAGMRVPLVRRDLYFLNAFAVEVRYSGASADAADAARAVAAMNRVRMVCRRTLRARTAVGRRLPRRFGAADQPGSLG